MLGKPRRRSRGLSTLSTFSHSRASLYPLHHVAVAESSLSPASSPIRLGSRSRSPFVPTRRWPRWRGLRTRWSLVAAIVSLIFFIHALLHDNALTTWAFHAFDLFSARYGPRMPNPPPQPSLPPRLPCIGPRGHLLSESPDDDLRPVDLDICTPLVLPFFFSFCFSLLFVFLSSFSPFLSRTNLLVLTHG